MINPTRCGACCGPIMPRSVALVRFALRDRFQRLQGRNTTAVPSSFILHLGMGALMVVALIILAITGDWLWAGIGAGLIALMWLANGEFPGISQAPQGMVLCCGFGDIPHPAGAGLPCRNMVGYGGIYVWTTILIWCDYELQLFV